MTLLAPTSQIRGRTHHIDRTHTDFFSSSPPHQRPDHPAQVEERLRERALPVVLAHPVHLESWRWGWEWRKECCLMKIQWTELLV